MHGDAPAATPVKGHPTARGPAEKWMLDCVHINKQVLSKGGPSYKALIVAIDVYSRFAVAMPVADITALNAMEFLAYRVFAHYGIPAEVITDGGPEFRKEFEQACKALGISQHRSVAYHAKGHGKVERLHKTLLGTIAKLIEDSSRSAKKSWVDLVPTAIMAYNSSVHEALSNGSVGLSPAEAFLGRRLQLGSKEISGTDTTNFQAKVGQLKRGVLEAMQWVAECEEKYNKKMEEKVAKKAREREFKLGDLVKLHRKLGNRTTSKVSRPKEGPYEIVGLPTEGRPSTYLARQIGGTKKRFDFAAEALELYHDMPDDEEGHDEEREEQESQDSENDEQDEEQDDTEYKVEYIVGERGNLKKGTKQYNCKLLGYEEPSWIVEKELFGCEKLIQAWHRSKARQGKGAKLATKKNAMSAAVEKAFPCHHCSRKFSSKAEVFRHLAMVRKHRKKLPRVGKVTTAFQQLLDHARNNPRNRPSSRERKEARTKIREARQERREARRKKRGFVREDLLSLPAEQALRQICELAGVDVGDVAHVHASPPCRTYSPADATNAGKVPPCNYRNPEDPERGPCCEDPACKYRRIALHDDNLVQHILSIFQHARESMPAVNVSLENPHGSLRLRPFMRRFESCRDVKCAHVDYCAYGYLYKKATDIWTTVLDWVPFGITGTGRCERKCGSGSWHWTHSGKERYRHFVALAQQPEEGIIGQGASRALNSIPTSLGVELLSASLSSWFSSSAAKMPSARQPVLIDLCAGYGSLRRAAEEVGMRYVGVDIRDLQ